MLLLRVDRVGACVEAIDPHAALSVDEYARWSRFASVRRRRQFLAGRQLLRQMLSAQVGAGEGAIAVEPGGALRVATPGLWVSISHSGEWVAAAVADRPVGVDIEVPRPGRDLSRLAESIGSLSGGSADFYTTWTLKEAVMKRWGMGLDLARMRALGAQPIDPQHANAQTASLELDGRSPLLYLAVAADGVGDLSVESTLSWCRETVAHWQLIGAHPRSRSRG
ncbi:4'-phosphopantetheinyl transferase family protein [Caldimonas sp. KR1-144]|uniref:4'-phosphopantetheinyl transferase family protein n=1 Tax=Caldimonas sp. KR1-144 TaxID=3400911 RepID=UPI003C00B3E3